VDIYQQLPEELRDALRAFENGALDRIIARKRPEDFAALRTLLSAPANPNDRQRAIYALGRWGNPSVVPEIVAVLPGLKESHAYTAIDTLGRLGTPEARAAVESYADHSSPQIRKFVVEALTRIADPAAQGTLEKMARADRTDWVRELAARRMKERLRK
jgi:HEAT repeat protein